MFCGIDEKPPLIEMSGGSLFSTPHYGGHEALLVRLRDVDRADLTADREESDPLKALPTLRRNLALRQDG